MPVVYKIDTVHRIVFTRGFGVVADEELLLHNIDLMADPAFDPTFDQLLDFTEVTGADIQSETIRRIARKRIFDLSSRRAIVVNTNLKFGFARMFQNLRLPEDENIKIFWNLSEARNWLGLGN